MGLPYGFRLSPFLIASWGIPYNVVSGQDVNGDSIFNDRPSFASSQSLPANVVNTKFGSFNTVPQPGEVLVPVNMLSGPSLFTLNLRVSKTFGFGKKVEATNTGGRGEGGGGPRGGGPGGGGPRGGGFGGRGGGGGGGGFDGGGSSGHRYSLTFAVSARNIFNNVNLATPIGNLSSPLFGESNQLANPPFSARPSANRRIDLQATFNF